MTPTAQASWAVGSALAFAGMSAAIKVGYAHFGLFELVFWRNALGAAVLAAWALYAGRRLATPLWPLHLRRSAAGTTSMVMWFAALAALPLPTAATLGNTSPLFVAVALAWAARRRGEPADRRRRLLYAAACCGFAGVVLALRPTLDGGTLWGFAAGLGSGLFATFVYFEMRSLGAAGEPSWRVVFWFSMFASAVGLVGIAASGGFSVITAEGAGWLCAVAGFALVGQICMTRAFAGPATLLAATLQYTNIGFAAIIAAFAFDEALTLREALGLAVIAGSGIAATVIAARAPAERRTSVPCDPDGRPAPAKERP
ncbi:MAG: DMT family transporter [Burkholderiaceae bacterium]